MHAFLSKSTVQSFSMHTTLQQTLTIQLLHIAYRIYSAALTFH